jgi:DNA topoisomerase I
VSRPHHKSYSMKKSLIVVESPTKIKSLKKFLSSDYIIESSYGHIIDLPEKSFGIDDRTFEPEYTTLQGKKQVIQDLKKAAAKCDTVYLAPDPDREGEAIAWHIASIMPKGIKIKRAVFNSVTKKAVQEAVQNPREIDMALVNAQQARRLLDRIVGYKISPVLSRKVSAGPGRRGLSAGRVQSVALKLVVDREKEIEAFKPVEYWNLSSFLKTPGGEFVAHLYSVDGLKVEKEPVEGKKVFLIGNEKVAREIEARLKKANYATAKVTKKEKKRSPSPPFITSTLQQEASRHLNFSPNKTMQVAQQLYEGIDLGSGDTQGLITYMRTDSVRLSPEGTEAARAVIEKAYGAKYLPEKPNVYTTKKSAQDAHEAIRPVDASLKPSNVSKYLSADQKKLYDLIWKRTIASQMNSAIYDTLSADISTDVDCMLRATGSVLKFDGHLRVYQELHDDATAEEDRLLPPLKEGQDLKLKKVDAIQAFTRPPPRFSEASLIKELEKSGIGRPSTYAAIMNKIKSRDYTEKDGGRLKPTQLGRVISTFLETNFPGVMNVDFTRDMEDELEDIADGKLDWKKLLKTFWAEFMPVVEVATKEAHVPKELTDITCPECKKHKLHKIWAKGKYFYGCSGYPECEYTNSIEGLNFKKEDYAADFKWDQPCPKCGGKMAVRHGRFGAFLGCLNYPKCRGLINIPPKGEKFVDLACPAKGCDGHITKKMSRFGRPFYSCSEFPECDVIVNDPADLKVKYKNHKKTAYVAKKGKGGGPGPKKLSKELQDIVGKKELSRPEVTKALWVYIKEHNLQDPSNKRRIVADEKLKKLFGGLESVDMFELARVISGHLS